MNEFFWITNLCKLFQKGMFGAMLYTGRFEQVSVKKLDNVAIITGMAFLGIKELFGNALNPGCGV